jgi:hypothetical protein
MMKDCDEDMRDIFTNQQDNEEKYAPRFSFFFFYRYMIEVTTKAFIAVWNAG